ncbi:hypothetical protein ACHQM5_025111 [Ranunculus cassubicifolius]
MILYIVYFDQNLEVKRDWALVSSTWMSDLARFVNLILLHYEREKDLLRGGIFQGPELGGSIELVFSHWFHTCIVDSDSCYGSREDGRISLSKLPLQVIILSTLKSARSVPLSLLTSSEHYMQGDFGVTMSW